MDRLRKIIFTGLLFSLFGCVSTQPNSINNSLSSASSSQSQKNDSKDCYPEESGKTVICDTLRGYTYWQPKWIADTDWRKRDVSINVYDFPITIEEQKKWKEYGHDVPLDSPCSPTTLGISSPTDLSKGAVKTLKGRVDYFDDGKELYSTEPRPLCVPPSLNGLSDAEIGKFAKTRAAYAFCSQKDGKTVLICISQMTKNEDVATKIFDSFKWTK